jgi:thiosulfate/3-mercaptopyruvate sulfurtransferase
MVKHHIVSGIVGALTAGALLLIYTTFVHGAPPQIDAISAQAPTEYANPDLLVSPDWVAARLDDADVRLIDLSDAEEVYEAGHIPGAVYVDMREDIVNPDDPTRGQIMTRQGMSELFSRLGIEQDDTLVLYDNKDNVQAARAYWSFKYYQHPDVRILNGGTGKWLDDGYELTTEEASFSKSNYIANEADPEIRTTWQDVVASVDDPSTLFCDTRSSLEYHGVNRRAEYGGHIPGAVNVDWPAAVNSDGTFRSAAELYTLYTEAGFTPDRQIIAYCQTGVRSAHTWVVLHELLGYPNVRNYDGSWEEYGNRSDSPIQ